MITAAQGKGGVADECRAKLAQRPQLTSYESFVWEAFMFELSSERQVGMSVGRIPRSKIIKYADDADMSRSMREAFIQEVMALDMLWQSHTNKAAANRNK